MDTETTVRTYQGSTKMLAWSAFENDAQAISRDDWYPVRGQWTPVYTDPIGTIYATPQAMIGATIARDVTNKMSRMWTRPDWMLSVEFILFTKKCPKCAERVKGAAVICRFCRYEWPESEVSPVTPPSREQIDILNPALEALWGNQIAAKDADQKTLTAYIWDIFAGGGWLVLLIVAILIAVQLIGMSSANSSPAATSPLFGGVAQMTSEPTVVFSLPPTATPTIAPPANVRLSFSGAWSQNIEGYFSYGDFSSDMSCEYSDGSPDTVIITKGSWTLIVNTPTATGVGFMELTLVGSDAGSFNSDIMKNPIQVQGNLLTINGGISSLDGRSINVTGTIQCQGQ